jgi:glycolate oxidase iron-sulfur subunit
MNQHNKQKLLAVADSCVKCGLCLPHCPTYTHTQNENESPRGRIALIQAWSNGQLPISPNLLNHIDSCLLCRACEKACPAVVPYGKFIDDFRAEVHEDKKPPFTARLLKNIVQNKNSLHILKKTLNVYQKHNIQAIARTLRVPTLFGLKKLERLIPPPQEAPILQTYYPAKTTKKKEIKGDVGLFVGCMGELADSETVFSTINILTCVGFNVHVPQHQTCCGALALHEGDKNTSDHLATQNTNAFSQENLQAIISIASGCGSTLREYNTVEFSSKVMDISHFLIQKEIDLSNLLKPLKATVTLHSPCSLKNGLRTEKSVAKLLQQIPQMTLTALPETTQCCGAAGSYSLRHEKMAQTLLDELLDITSAQSTDYLVSSNIGCSLHIAAGLREKNMNITVIHPMVLLARQLKTAKAS